MFFFNSCVDSQRVFEFCSVIIRRKYQVQASRFQRSCIYSCMSYCLFHLSIKQYSGGYWHLCLCIFCSVVGSFLEWCHKSNSGSNTSRDPWSKCLGQPILFVQVVPRYPRCFVLCIELGVIQGICQKFTAEHCVATCVGRWACICM